MRCRQWIMLCGLMVGTISDFMPLMYSSQRVAAQEVVREPFLFAFDQTELEETDFFTLQPSPPKTVKPEPATPTKPAPAPKPTVPPAPVPRTTSPTPSPAQAINTQPLANPPTNPFLNAQGNQAMNQPNLARLSRTPDMFGDSFASQSFQFIDDGSNLQGPINVPFSGRFKNEHNVALPTDRVFFYYHHFHNAISVFDANGSRVAKSSIDRFTVGIEKTFADGDMSLEVRMPFTSTTNLASNASLQSGNVGDLVINLKALLYQDDEQALAFGLATSVPTGENAFVTADSERYKFETRAVYIVPYVAYLLTLNDDWFFQAWLQTDFAATPNRFIRNNASADVRDQTLFYADLVVGRWFWRNEESTWLTGAALMTELHYTTALTRADRVNFGSLIFGNSPNHFDVVNLTVGSNIELTHATLLRTGFTFPLRSTFDNRFFDAEFTAAIVYRY